jgi:RecA-family ATPase
MNELGISLGEAERFLTLLDETAIEFTFQTFDDNRDREDPKLVRILHGTLAEHAETLTRLNNLGAGIFVMVQEGDGLWRGNENVTRIRAVFQEDDGDGKPLPLEPHIINESSPGKHHRYLLTEGLSVEEFRLVQARLVVDYGSDKNAQDPARVLRLPGFYHQKVDSEKRLTGKPFMVRITHESGAQPYEREDLLKAIPPLLRAERRGGGDHSGAVRIDDRTYRDLRSALTAIRSDDRELWISMGMALKGLGDVGRSLWLEWSQTSEKYDPQDAARVWDSFKPEHTGYAAVFAEAQRQGWVNSSARDREESSPNDGWQWPEGASDRESGGQKASLGEAKKKRAPHPAFPEMPLYGELAIKPEERSRARLTPICLVENYLYGDVAILASAGGTGKTTLILFEAVHIALGIPLYGLKVRTPGSTLVITGEDSRERMIARLQKIVESMKLSDEEVETVFRQVRIWDVSGELCRLSELGEGNNIVLTGLANHIVERCKSDQDAPILVVFDPTISFGVGERMVNDNEQSLVLAGRRISRGLNCCVRFVHHTGKVNARQKTLDQYSARGGSAFADGARMVAILSCWDPEDGSNLPPYGFSLREGERALILSRAKITFTPPQLNIWLKRRENEYAFDHFIGFRQSKEKKQEANADQVEKFLADQLKRGFYHTKNTLEAEELLPRNELRKALVQLEKGGRVIYRGFSQPHNSC